MFKENKLITKEYATKQEVERIVEESADSVMRSCAVQFTVIDKRFLEIDKRFDRLEGKIDAQTQKIDSLIVFMRGHEKRLTRVEKHLQLA